MHCVKAKSPPLWAVSGVYFFSGEAHEALAQHMQEKTPEEFFTAQMHLLILRAITVVFVAQGHLLAIVCEQVCIAQRGAVTITPRVINDGVGARQAWLGVHHSLLGHQCVEHRLNRIAQATELAVVDGLA